MLVRIASRIASIKRSSSRPNWLMRLLGLESQAADLSDSQQHRFHRGLVMVQIDGLSHHEFHRALKRGELPFLKDLLDRQHYETHSLYSGIPSSTPAVQGELFYGVKSAVPAFAFIDHVTGKLKRMLDSESASAVQEQLEKRGRPLLANGSAYCNIYTGGAAESHFCAASMGLGHSLDAFKPLARLGIGILFLPTAIRTITLTLVEVVLAIVDFLKGIKSGYRILPELKFIFSRVAICIALRDLVSIGAQVDILRGLPVIHLNLIGYDEQAHRRGPHSAFAHWTLKGIDRCIKRIWNACNSSPVRHYDLWVYSDHGQETTVPYQRRSGMPISDAIRVSIQNLESDSPAPHSKSTTRPISSIRTRFLGGRILQRILPSTAITTESEAGPDFHVAAMGPVGLVYAPVLLNAQNRRTAAQYLVRDAHIPAAMYVDEHDEVIIRTAGDVFHLPRDSAAFAGKFHTFAEIIGDDLAALCRHRDAGQLVLLGWSNNAEATSFPTENGAHAGPGSRETHAFALLPADTELPVSTNGMLRPLDLREAAFSVLDQDPGMPTSNRYPRARSGMKGIMPGLENDKGASSGRTLRIMTYNVHGCVGMDGRHSPERIARVIAHYEPDVVALQELDVNRDRSQQVNQAETIARLLEMQYHFHPSMHVEAGAYGNAILTHLPMQIVKADRLPGHPGGKTVEPRGAIWATLEFAGTSLQVLCTHLGLYPEERISQVQALQSKHWLEQPEFLDNPSIVCGDFNATAGSAVMKNLDSYWLDVHLNCSTRNNTRTKTFSSVLPAVRIDHVFTNADFRSNRVQVPRFELARRASDHLPLIVDLDFDQAYRSVAS